MQSQEQRKVTGFTLLYYVPKYSLGFQRYKEYDETRDAALKTAIGSRISELIEIGYLVTRPDRQGRGYASALVRLGTALVCLFSPSLFDVCFIVLLLLLPLFNPYIGLTPFNSIGRCSGPSVLARLEQHRQFRVLQLAWILYRTHHGDWKG